MIAAHFHIKSPIFSFYLSLMIEIWYISSFFVEIYQIWLENFEEIIVISNIKTVIPPDKQHEWVKRAKYQKTAHRPFL